MALLAVMLEPYIKTKVNLLKTLRMILIHDIVELTAKDFNPVAKHNKGGGHAFNHKAFNEKYQREINAAEEVFKELPKNFKKEFKSLFREYIGTKASPETATPEGKFAYALDKIEAAIQIIDWRAPKKNWQKEYFEKSMKYLFEWSSYDQTLKSFCDLIRKEGQQIIVK